MLGLFLGTPELVDHLDVVCVAPDDALDVLPVQLHHLLLNQCLLVRPFVLFIRILLEYLLESLHGVEDLLVLEAFLVFDGFDDMVDLDQIFHELLFFVRIVQKFNQFGALIYFLRRLQEGTFGQIVLVRELFLQDQVHELVDVLGELKEAFDLILLGVLEDEFAPLADVGGIVLQALLDGIHKLRKMLVLMLRLVQEGAVHFEVFVLGVDDVWLLLLLLLLFHH
eukprot:CAMPEP_0170544594 /NCGR_PEP_ID=MMETSP0211-20121228/3291_1 /TAXON_ID=311385 /ORGANISM="Pseudokeronopsis sp., Strain OXSARD2" /LENGTH=223 /DNA_ID=CAMNT_0010848279 /DNA_START=1315 /DNA_END=1983 /DNA_ORIENTATION=-